MIFTSNWKKLKKKLFSFPKRVRGIDRGKKQIYDAVRKSHKSAALSSTTEKAECREQAWDQARTRNGQ
jgi:hypothetical protein